MKHLTLGAVLMLCTAPLLATEPFCPEGSAPEPHVLFCDSYEIAGASDSEIFSDPYFDFNDDDGDLQRSDLEAAEGSHSMRVLWQAGEVAAGAFFVNFGRSPLFTVIHPDEDFREIYWRLYVKHPPGFQGFPSKLTRITSFATPNWAQAMVGHIWSNSQHDRLILDPVSGIENDVLVTTGWNDFANFTWLGQAPHPTTPMPMGDWVCVEGHVRLNDPGQINGQFDLYINGELQSFRHDYNWVGNWSDYALNSIHFSNYWNAGSPVEQARYIDALVIATERIGCLGDMDLIFINAFEEILR